MYNDRPGKDTKPSKENKHLVKTKHMGKNTVSSEIKKSYKINTNK
jgi:hypothetical protein